MGSAEERLEEEEQPLSASDSLPTPPPIPVIRDAPQERTLTALDKRILAFERMPFTHAGAKDEAIRFEFALTAARYYQLLNAAIDLPESTVFDPMLVRRLQRLRDSRTNIRVARSFDAARQNDDRP